MFMSESEALIHRWFDEVWNRGREETIDQLFAAEAIAHGLGEEDVQVRGPEQFKVFWRNLRSALPDIQIRIEDTTATEDKAVVRVVLTGTHTGNGLGVPPTGNHVAVSGIVIVRLSGGQIIEGWNSWDQLGLLRQIGAIPKPSNAGRFLVDRA
jgi:steroid delta-isomerase-like uncharacterized protein